MTVFDSSALLAYLFGEQGAGTVAAALAEGGVIGAANWSEVAQKAAERTDTWALARDLLMSFDLRIEPVDARTAELAAGLWRRGEGLPLGDRLCLALGERNGHEVLTADRAWAGRPGVRLLR